MVQSLHCKWLFGPRVRVGSHLQRAHSGERMPALLADSAHATWASCPGCRARERDARQSGLAASSVWLSYRILRKSNTTGQIGQIQNYACGIHTVDRDHFRLGHTAGRREIQDKNERHCSFQAMPKAGFRAPCSGRGDVAI